MAEAEKNKEGAEKKGKERKLTQIGFHPEKAVPGSHLTGICLCGAEESDKPYAQEGAGVRGYVCVCVCVCAYGYVCACLCLSVCR